MRAVMGAIAISIFIVPVVDAIAQNALTVGEGWAAVVETRTINFTGTEQVVEVNDLPGEIDLSSLRLYSDRQRVQLLSWSRQAEASVESRLADNGAFPWRPGAAAVPEPSERSDAALMCRIGVDTPGPCRCTLAYLMDGMSWRANYNVLIRGDISNEQERISVDLSGGLILSNATSHTFEDATIRVVGPDRSGHDDKLSSAGFLIMEDDPLADLWMRKKSAKSVSYFYSVPQPARVADHAETEIALVNLKRKQADRKYLMKSSEFPTQSKDEAAPLRRLIVLNNTAAVGAGQALPAGPATVFMGGARPALSQKAWFAHTPAEGSFRIDLGPADRVLGTRIFAGQSKVASDFHDENYIFRIENRLTSSAAIEIEEEPQTTLQWGVVNASADYVVQGRKIYFTLSVPPSGTVDVRYTLRVRELSI